MRTVKICKRGQRLLNQRDLNTKMACRHTGCSDILNQQHTLDTGGFMVCSTCGTPNRERAKFCHRCGSAMFRDERLRQLDVCFVMDATGSMRDHIDAARKNLQTLASRLTSHPMHPNMSYALLLYRDHA